MRTLRLLAAAAAACVAIGCSGSTDPNPPGSGTDPVGLWDATVSGIQGLGPGGQPATCTARWATSIEAAGEEPTRTVLMRLPYNTSLQCGQGAPGIWIERGRQFFSNQSGDTLAFLSVTRSDTFLVAQFTNAITLTGRMVDINYPGAVFRATRRSGPDPNRSPYVLEIHPDWPDVEIGDSTAVGALVYDAYFDPVANPGMSWSSSAPDVAPVDEAGIVRGVIPGTATITGAIDTLEQSVTITVLTPAASVEIAAAPDSIIAPGTSEARAAARDAGGQILLDRRFHWTSSNPAVATVSEYGETAGIASVAPGTVTISARSTTATASVTFDVLPAVAEITIGGVPAVGRLTIGSTAQLTAITRDAGGNLLTGRPVSWTIESPAGGVGVSPAGLVSATKADTGRITAQAEGVTETVEVLSLMDGPLAGIAAGDGHTCGLTITDRVYCWGHAGDGRLGMNQSGGAGAVPVPIPTNRPIIAIEAGSLHTCVLDDGGQAFCWGANGADELGGPGGVEGEVHHVVAGTGFIGLSLGGGFSCGVDPSNDVYCWGTNGFGELGRGVTTDGGNSAGPVTGSHEFTEVRAGSSHACGLTTAGEVWCWGDNQFGELGLGATDSDPHPTPAHAAAGVTFTTLAAGGTRVCGITTGGPVVCWGQGQPAPAEVDNSTGVTQITGGGRHFCGTDGSGRMSCWGETDRFNLGYTPAEPVVAFTAGNVHTCAIPAGSRAICWGFNDGGQIGTTDGESLGPVEVMGQP